MNNNDIKQALDRANKALKALIVAVNKPMEKDLTNIDATIQRFEFTFELFWKALRQILAAKGVQAIYPRDVLQQAFVGHLIDNEQLWLDMLTDRNLTSHTYNEALARKIYDHIKNYCPVLEATLEPLLEVYR